MAALRAERAPVRGALVRAQALALARLGRHAEAAGPLALAAAEHPRDEEVLAELLRGEAATAGPSAALMRYEAYRRELRDELGTDPGAGLKAVQQELLRGEAPVVRHGVPHEPNPLLGRDEDIAAVERLLRLSRAVTVVGPGGLGKTRLAHAVSRRAEQRVVYFVPLAGVTADEDVAAEVASALGAGDGRHAAISGHSPPIRCPASSARWAPGPRCWSSTTASRSSGAPPPSYGPWSPPPTTCGCSPPAGPRWGSPRRRCTPCRSSGPTPRPSCSRSGPGPPGPGWSCRRTRWPSCAATSTGCRSPSSWPRRGCGSCRFRRSPAASATGSRCCAAVRGTCRSVTARCTRSWSGAGTFSPRTPGRRCARCPSSPAAARARRRSMCSARTRCFCWSSWPTSR